jgi:tetratricopeptide (TPR) repeat protein
MTPLSELCRTLARADVARGDGDLDEARALYRHALVVVEATDEPWTAELTAQALFGLGMVALLERRAEEAHGFLTRSLAAEQARQDVPPQDAGRRHSAAVTAAWLGACERDDAGTHLAAAVTELAALAEGAPDDEELREDLAMALDHAVSHAAREGEATRVIALGTQLVALRARGVELYDDDESREHLVAALIVLGRGLSAQGQLVAARARSDEAAHVASSLGQPAVRRRARAAASHARAEVEGTAGELPAAAAEYQRCLELLEGQPLTPMEQFFHDSATARLTILAAARALDGGSTH